MGHSLAQLCSCSPRHQHTYLVIGDFGNTAAAHRHHGQAARHGLRQHQAEGFIFTAMNKHITTCQQPRELVGVALIGPDGDVAAAGFAAPPTDQQQVIPGPQAFGGRDQYRQVLLLGKASGVNQ